MKINALTLYTSRLKEQTTFYAHTLGLPLKKRAKKSVEFKIGYSTLKLEYKKNATPYHFAINIPSNKDREALGWLKKRVSIIKDKEDEIVHFKKWNATAIYFYDPDKNIVEFIARRGIKIQRRETFDQNQLVGISEIGMPVEDIRSTFDSINDLKKIIVYDGDFNRFCAAGDEQGLFIIINKNTRKWFPIDDIAFSSDFKLRGDINLDFIKGNVKSLPNQKKKYSKD